MPCRSNHGSALHTFNTRCGVNASPTASAGGNADCGSPSVATLFATPWMSPTLSLDRVPAIELSEELDELALSLEPTWSYPSVRTASSPNMHCYLATHQYGRPIVELNRESLKEHWNLRCTI